MEYRKDLFRDVFPKEAAERMSRIFCSLFVETGLDSFDAASESFGVSMSVNGSIDTCADDAQMLVQQFLLNAILEFISNSRELMESAAAQNAKGFSVEIVGELNISFEQRPAPSFGKIPHVMSDDDFFSNWRRLVLETHNTPPSFGTADASGIMIVHVPITSGVMVVSLLCARCPHKAKTD